MNKTEEECAWMREYFFMSKGLDNKIIIFGHTPTCYIHQASGCFDVWYDPVFKDKIGIDGGLGPFDKGQLNCLCLNTQEVFVIKKVNWLFRNRKNSNFKINKSRIKSREVFYEFINK